MTRRLWILLVAALALGGCRSKPDAGQLPSLGEAPRFALVDQGGKRVTAADFRGQPYVAAFFFTRCPTVCPRLMKRLRWLQQEAASRKLPLRIVSISVDPDHDTPQVLRQFAGKYEADFASWSLLTGELEQVEQASAGFKLALEGSAKPDAEHFGITHGSHLVLVDGRGQIRGYYRSSDDEKMQELLADIGRLGD